MAGEVLICFSCCMQQPAPKRRQIDRTMIGNPTNFRHTGHIGSSEVGNHSHQLDGLQTQMRSKGGYNHVSPVGVQLNLINLDNNSA